MYQVLKVSPAQDKLVAWHGDHRAASLRLRASASWADPSGRADLRRGPAAARSLGLRVRIPPEAWIFVCCECCVFSGRSLCVGLITRPEEPYLVWCVWVWSWSPVRTRHDTESGWSATKKNYSMRPYCRAPCRAFTGCVSSSFAVGFCCLATWGCAVSHLRHIKGLRCWQSRVCPPLVFLVFSRYWEHLGYQNSHKPSWSFWQETLTRWPVRHRTLAHQRVTEFNLLSGWGQETAFCEYGDKLLRFMKCELLC